MIFCYSCNSSSNAKVTDWTNKIKSSIIEDANQPYDQIILDTSRSELTYLRNNKKLRYYYLRPRHEQGIIAGFDTAASIFCSTNQTFELVKEHCPIAERSFEGIRYNGYWVGVLEYRYCDGKPKNIHFSYNEKFGIESEYDSTGNLIKEITHGNLERLEKLLEIKYYR